MSQSREKHTTHLSTLVRFDLEGYSLNLHTQKLYRKRKEVCNQKLTALRILANRKEIFEKNLGELLKRNEINQLALSIILEFIEKILINKITIAEAFALGLYTSMIAKIRISNPDLDINNIKKVMKETGLEIDNTEHTLTLDSLVNNEVKRSEYLKLKNELSICEKAINDLCRIQEELEEQVLQNYKMEDLTEAKELEDLCLQLQNKNIEIMLILDADMMDIDLASVIKMKIENARKKGNELILMPFKLFDAIIKNGHSIDGVNKLSFLHHGSERQKKLDYVTEIGNYINQMPALKEIVIRGCGTANKPDDKEIVYNVKMSKIPYDETPLIQGSESLVIQQKQCNGKLYTKASWVTLDEYNKRHIHQITDIISLSKINSKKLTEQHLQELEKIEGMPLLKHGSEYVASMRAKFFDPRQTMTPDEINKAKKAFRRARTETVSISNGDVLSKVWENITPEQRTKVSVKAFVGAYEVNYGRVIPEDQHDQGSSPKAVRIGPRFHRSVHEVKKDIPTTPCSNQLLAKSL